MSIRARVSVTTAFVAGLVVLLATVLVLQLAAADRRRDLDLQLRREAGLGAVALQRLVTASGPERVLGGMALPHRSVRLLDGAGRELLQVGEALPDPPSVQDPTGVRAETVEAADGTAWRVVTRPAGNAGQVRFIQVAAPVAEADGQNATLTGAATAIGVCAVGGAAALGFLSGGLAVRRLGRLRRTADSVAASGDPDIRVDPTGLPSELAELAERMNTMLQRLADAREEQGRTLATSRAFAAEVAHELRTPLSSMSANLEALQAESGAGNVAAEILTDLVTEQRRLTRTVEALYALTSIELAEAPSDQVDLGDLVELAAARARRRHRHLTVLVELPDGSMDVVGSPDGLAVVVANLIDNAAVHARRGDEPVQVRVGVQLTADRWLLAVDDDGPGVPWPDRRRVLGRFERGGTTARGTGLGLAIVAGQVARHGGEIALEESPLGGLRAVVACPLAPAHGSGGRRACPVEAG